ncbi:hypothetical protein BT96DRAFT_951120, partial [Gymnopus androsaceus JB14]
VSASNSSIWALIDVDAKAEEPVGLAAALRVFAVQVASPDPKRYHIWLERRHVRTWGFPFWTVEELLAGWKVQQQYTQTIKAIDYWLNHQDNPVKPEFELHLIHCTTLEDTLISGRDFTHIHNKHEDEMMEDKDVHVDEHPQDNMQEQQQSVSTINPEEAAKILLSHAITHYGWAACDVYEYLHDPSEVVDRHEQLLKLPAEIVWEDTFKFVKHFVVTGAFAGGHVFHSHRTIAVKLNSDVVRTSLKENDKWFPIIKSNYIAGKMDKKLLRLTDEKRRNYYDTFKGLSSDGASLAGVCEVHDKICKGVPLS